MKRFVQFTVLMILAACKVETDERVFHDLEPYYTEVAQMKIDRAAETWLSGHEMRMKTAYQRMDNPDEALVEMSAKLDQMHGIAKQFFGYADSVLLRCIGRKDYPLQALIARYQNAIDSINILHRMNESKIVMRDYNQYPMSNSPVITIAQMKADVADNAHLAMYAYIDVTAPHGIFDDFSRPSARPLFQQGATYAFTVHYRTGQEFPGLRLDIRSILRNGKKVKQKALIHRDDILWVVNFDKLEKGTYEVKGRVRAATGKLDERPFVHRFQIL